MLDFLKILNPRIIEQKKLGNQSIKEKLYFTNMIFLHEIVKHFLDQKSFKNFNI
jgi:hypothetical protein